MSAALDANILLYASDESSRHFAAARGFLAARAAGTELLYVAWPTVMAYLRIATHPTIFLRPLSPDDAMANISALLALPTTRVIHEEEGFWEAYREVARSVPARGNTVPDAHLAALLQQHGVKTLYTADADFRRYRFLDVRNPLD